MEQRICARPNCGKPIPHRGKSFARYCSAACQKQKNAQKYVTYGQGHLAPGTLGATSEMLVCADLLLQGYEVYRAISPHSSCDLVILKDGRTQRVEVKPGYRHPNGRLVYSVQKHQRGQADIVAVVLGVGDIASIPALDVASMLTEEQTEAAASTAAAAA